MRSRFSLTNAEMAAALSISIQTLRRMQSGRRLSYARPGGWNLNSNSPVKRKSLLQIMQSA